MKNVLSSSLHATRVLLEEAIPLLLMLDVPTYDAIQMELELQAALVMGWEL